MRKSVTTEKVFCDVCGVSDDKYTSLLSCKICKRDICDSCEMQGLIESIGIDDISFCLCSSCILAGILTEKLSKTEMEFLKLHLKHEDAYKKMKQAEQDYFIEKECLLAEMKHIYEEMKSGN